MVGIIMILMASVLLLIAIYVFVHSKEKQLHERMMHHFKEVLPYSGMLTKPISTPRQSNWDQLKIRASIYVGFELQRLHVMAFTLALACLSLLGWMLNGLGGALLLLLVTVFVFGFLLPNIRLSRRRKQIVAQVPLFIDLVLRSLSTGRSLESAFRFASSETPPPLRHVLNRVLRAADLGADMVENLSETARLHALRELNLIALAMRISNNYGSSPREMLESVVKMIRQQELARRELAAMTGETRISAWVLGITPIAIASYIMVMNPNYLNILLQDPSGRTMMVTALGLQGIGTFILWRMMRSV
jgi:tight adherence protein B